MSSGACSLDRNRGGEVELSVKDTGASRASMLAKKFHLRKESGYPSWYCGTSLGSDMPKSCQDVLC